MLRYGKTAAALLVAGTIYATPAYAQATRTWVSGVGDDVNPCSRTAPCKTFAGAISKTAAGGEINCLDPGGFGAVTITKSITIDCEDTQGSILASSTTGVIVNGANVIVTLRGLSISGSPPTSPGVNGVRYLQGASLLLDEVLIQNFTGAAPNGAGIMVNPTSGSARLTVLNSVITNNGLAASGGGIVVAATGNTPVTVTVRNTHFVNNANSGVKLDTTGNTSTTGINASLNNVTVTGSTSGVVAFQPAGAAPVTIGIGDSTIANNGSFGLLANGANTRIRIGSSEVTNNGTAAAAFGGGVVNSIGNNLVAGNATSDGTFVAIPPT